MAENTEISWADDTFNPWIGCMKVGPACDGCYAEALMDTRYGRVEWGAPGKGVGTRVRTVPSTWAKPKKWNREQEAYAHNCRLIGETAEPRFVFCASLADVFDNAVPPEWRRDLFDLIRATPHLTWLLLTKRPQNIARLFAETITPELRKAHQGPEHLGRSLWPRNAAIGCTVVTQEEADRDVPHLLRAKAGLNPAFAFLSMEPLLGRVNLRKIKVADGWYDALDGWRDVGHQFPGIDETLDWVITGGETDQGAHKARPLHPEWLRSLRDQCAAAAVPFHLKQLGEFSPLAVCDPDGPARTSDVMVWPNGFVGGGTHTQHGGYGSIQRHVGKKASGRLLDGALHDARPAVRS